MMVVSYTVCTLASLFGTFVTYGVNIKAKQGPVRASALVALATGLFFYVFQDSLPVFYVANIPMYIVGGSFIGMVTSTTHINRYSLAFSAGVYAFLLWFAARKFDGFGGSLGLLACVALMCTMALPMLTQKYNSLIELYRIEQLYDKALTVNKQLLELAKKEKNQTEITKSYVYQAVILNNDRKFDKVASYVDSAKVSASRIEDKKALAYVQYLNGYIAKDNNDYKNGMTHFLKSLSLLEQSKGDLFLEFKIYYNLYGIYTEWNDLQNSKKYAQKAIEIAQKSGNKNDLSNAYAAMATVYTYQYQTSKEEVDFQAILDYCEKAASLYTEFPGQVGGYTYTIARNNKASYLLAY